MKTNLSMEEFNISPIKIANQSLIVGGMTYNSYCLNTTASGTNQDWTGDNGTNYCGMSDGLNPATLP